MTIKGKMTIARRAFKRAMRNAVKASAQNPARRCDMLEHRQPGLIVKLAKERQLEFDDYVFVDE